MIITNNNIENYNVKIKVLGPLFIGNGQTITKAEYIQDYTNKRIYILDTLKMFNGLKKFHLLEEYENYILRNKKIDLSDFLKQHRINSSEYRKWVAYSYPTTPDTGYKISNILPFVKDAYNLPYLPGSSFKGAIHNAFVNAKLLKADPNNLAKKLASIIDDNTKRINPKTYLNTTAKKIDTNFTHKEREHSDEPLESAVNSIFRGLIISDSKPLKPEDIILCPKVDLAVDGKKNKLNNVLRECIKPGTIIELNMSIDKEIFKYNQKSIENFIKNMYNNINEKFLKDFPFVHSHKGCLIYIGGGAGFQTKTIGYSLFKDKAEAVDNVSKILDKVSTKSKKTGKMGMHLDDSFDCGVSPRVRKCTLYNRKLYDFGLCHIEFQPMP